MKKKVTLSLRKLLCVALALLMISGVGISATAAEDTAQKNYIIDNPYEGIDWDALCIMLQTSRLLLLLTTAQ